MKILKSTLRNKGYGLILALTFVLIMLVLLASTMQWSASDSKATQRNNQFVSSQYAAEAAVETAIADMNNDFLQASMTNGSQYTTFLPTNNGSWPGPIQYIFSNPNTNGANTNEIYAYVGVDSANEVPLPAPYTGLSAFVQQCDVAATATPTGQRYNVPATVRESFWASSIPIFQYVIFYNLDLEIDPGASMPINGPTFSNGSIWSGGANPVYNGSVSAVGTINTSGTDPLAAQKTDSAGGTPAGNFKSTKTSGAEYLNLPVAGANNVDNSPTNIYTILEWPPSAYAFGTAAAYTTNGQTYLANAADLIISNSISGTNSLTPSGTNFTVYFQDSASSPALTTVSNDFYIIQISDTNLTVHTLTNYYYFTNYVGTNGTYRGFITNFGSGTNIPVIGATTNRVNGGTTNVFRTSLAYAGYSFLTNVLFYDWREGWNNGSGIGGKGKPVQAVQFDVSAFNAWLSGTNLNGTTNRMNGIKYRALCISDKGGTHTSPGGIYISTSVPATTTNLPAVRVVNGSKLYDSFGLTIATPFPLYIKGDYNVTDGHTSDAGKNVTANTFPAAFLADSITFLSSSWSDASAKNVASASVDTLNAACLEGIVPSNNSFIADGSYYSGGVENFIRLLESWSNNKLYYNGSIVVMFPSQYATNRWRTTGNYYNAPARNWAFDSNFVYQAKLPPMTPQVKAFVRTTWTGH